MRWGQMVEDQSASALAKRMTNKYKLTRRPRDSQARSHRICPSLVLWLPVPEDEWAGQRMLRIRIGTPSSSISAAH